MNTIFKAAMLATVVLSTSAVFADDTGVAAGSNTQASNTAKGSTATIVAAGVGTAAIIGAIIAGSSDNGNGTATSTSTTATH